MGMRSHARTCASAFFELDASSGELRRAMHPRKLATQPASILLLLLEPRADGPAEQLRQHLLAVRYLRPISITA